MLGRTSTARWHSRPRPLQRQAWERVAPQRSCLGHATAFERAARPHESMRTCNGKRRRCVYMGCALRVERSEMRRSFIDSERRTGTTMELAAAATKYGEPRAIQLLGGCPGTPRNDLRPFPREPLRSPRPPSARTDTARVLHGLTVRLTAWRRALTWRAADVLPANGGNIGRRSRLPSWPAGLASQTRCTQQHEKWIE